MHFIGSRFHLEFRGFCFCLCKIAHLRFALLLLARVARVSS